MGRLRRELEDAATLAVSLVVVPCTWWLLGWRWPLAVSAQDGIANLLVLLQALSESGGDWSRASYRADLLGGMTLRDAVGPFPPFALLTRLGLSPTATLDLTSFLLQAVIAFLGGRAAGDLAGTWTGRRVRLRWWGRLAGVWACGFAPVLGWKIGAGHQTLVTGMLPFLAAFGLLAATGAGTVSVFLIAVCAAALACGVLFTGHQMVVYGAIFGGPILFGGWWANGGRPRHLVLPAAVGLGAFLFALPGLWGVLAHALGTDSLRTPTGMRLTYSYLTSQPLDWLGSLLWTARAVLPSRPALLHHEINNPIGPMVLLLVLVPWHRARALAVGTGVSAAAALLFSTNVKPFSDALLLLFPLLGSFRVPTRAILPVLFLLPILAMAGALARQEHPWFPRLATVAGLVVFLLPSPLREAAGWTVAAFAILPSARQGRFTLPAAAAVLVLAGGGLGAFRERLLSFPYALSDGEALLARARESGADAKRRQPALASMLVRISPSPEWRPEWLANAAPAAALSSLDGYYFPQRRFVELVCALRGQEYKPNALLLRFTPQLESARALFQLYDVAWRLDASGALTSLPETAGAAWFSASVIRTPDFASLGAALVAQGDGLHARAQQAAWLVSSDPMVARALLPDTIDTRCADARVEVVEAPRAASLVRARVSAPADCPLTFATNYAEALRATVATPQGAISAQVYPAYGALAGVWVPRGTVAVTLQALSPGPPHPALCRGLGAAVLLAAIATQVTRRG